MTAPSLMHAARTAPDAYERIRAMAGLMSEAFAAEGSCTFARLHAGGFTEAEIRTYHDDAIGVLEGRPSRMRCTRPGKREGHALAMLAEAIGCGRARRPWRRPRVGRERIGRHG